MKQVYTDKGSNLLYIRDDGKLFVQLRPNKRQVLNSLCTEIHCVFEQPNSVVYGDIIEITSTGVVLTDWRIEQCQ